MAEIRLEGVTKTFGGGRVRAVDDVSLTVSEGEFVVLLGPSGCGKTTLLRSIAGLEPVDAGRILIGDRDVTFEPPRRRNVSMVFQNYAVFPHLKVFDNIAFGLRMRRQKDGLRERVERAAALVELTDLLDRYPAQLSGGQQQRVSVARAIAVEPAVLLMDEPLSNLDALLRLNFRSDLKRLVSELGTTTVYVTHDQIEALSLGDRVAVMRTGRIVQVGTPMEVYDDPATTFVGGFIGNPPMNFLEVGLERSDGGSFARLGGQRFPVTTPRGSGAGAVLAGIRAENIAVSAPGEPGTLRARVEVVEPLGAQVLLTVVAEGTRLKVLADNATPARPAEDVGLRLDPHRVRWFDPASGERL